MKNRINFTKDNIDALPLPESGKRDVYHDTKKSGLQIRVTSKGVKTFCFYGRIKGGKPERVTLGKYPVMSIGNAREKAASIGGLAAQGISTSEAVRSLRSDTTLQELFDDFLENRRNRSGAYLSDKTKRSYRYDFGLYLAKWGKRKLSQFNDSDFDKLHTDVGKIHPTTANRIIALASSLFSFAGERKFFTGENPARGIKKFKETSRRKFFTPLPNAAYTSKVGATTVRMPWRKAKASSWATSPKFSKTSSKAPSAPTVRMISSTCLKTWT